jgi:hypothetical protein
MTGVPVRISGKSGFAEWLDLKNGVEKISLD